MDKPAAVAGERLTQIVATKATELLVFTCSGVMQETTGWRPHDLPSWPKSDKTFRVLLLLGNFMHFANDGVFNFWADVISGPWDHYVYVPGLRDYGGGGTLQLGDDFLGILSQWGLDYNLTVFATHCKTRALFFTGPNVFMAGAPLFPITTGPYFDAAIYACWNDESSLEAVTKHHAVSIASAKQRRDLDVQSLLRSFETVESDFGPASPARQSGLVDRELGPATLVIVSHSSPDEMAASGREAHPFASVCKLGTRRTYEQFAGLGLRYWFCGAPLDLPIMTMRDCPTKLVSNTMVLGNREMTTKEPVIITRNLQ
jgi:hypothetical protein